MSGSSSILKGIVAEAEEIVASIKDEEMRRIAFGPVLERLLSENGANGGQAVAAGNGRSGDGRAMDTAVEPADGSYANAEQRADSVAHFLQIDPAKALDLFNLDGPEPGLQIPSKSVPSGKSAGTRMLTLLLCSVRLALGIETTTQHVREAVDQYGRYDAANFMKTLTMMPEIVVRGKPQSSNRVIRLRMTGEEAARDLVASL